VRLESEPAMSMSNEWTVCAVLCCAVLRAQWTVGEPVCRIFFNAPSVSAPPPTRRVSGKLYAGSPR